MKTFIQQLKQRQKINLPYGHSNIELTLPEGAIADVFNPPPTVMIPKRELMGQIQQALCNPLSADLVNFSRARSVAIAINDKTRPVPHDLLLPSLLRTLTDSGIERDAICFYIANGTHLPMRPEEYTKILPEEIIVSSKIISHDCDAENDLVSLGTTMRGTEVQVNASFYRSELKIVVGNIEPHHFAGFSGGVKTAAIGLGSRTTINQNHSMLIDPNATIGAYTTNPLRQDIEEIGRIIDIQFALNVIISGEKQIARVLFGNPEQVMMAGIPIAKRICQVPFSDKYDLVIASAGGYPKDINLYQAQKALTHASLLVKESGMIILIAECSEGSGSTSYEAYMKGMSDHKSVLDKFSRDGFRVGPHKAFQISRIANQTPIVLVSELPERKVRDLLLIPANTLKKAIDYTLSALMPNPKIAILPHATSTIPINANQFGI